MHLRVPIRKNQPNSNFLGQSGPLRTQVKLGQSFLMQTSCSRGLPETSKKTPGIFVVFPLLREENGRRRRAIQSPKMKVTNQRHNGGRFPLLNFSFPQLFGEKTPPYNRVVGQISSFFSRKSVIFCGPFFLSAKRGPCR